MKIHLSVVILVLGTFSPMLRAAPPIPVSDEVQEDDLDQDQWDKDHPDMSDVESAVIAKLLQAESTLVSVVKQANESDPKNAQEAMFNYCVFVRAGMPEEARRAVLDFKRLCPASDEWQGERIYEAAIYHFPKGDLSWAVIEILADDFTASDRLQDLFEHWLQTGWTVDRVDQWLASRSVDDKRDWVMTRLAFNKRLGKERAFERELEDGVRRNPGDIRRAINYLRAIDEIPLDEEESRDLAWFSELVHPKSALDAKWIGTLLVSLQQPETAAKFYRLAIAIPVTEEEDLDDGAQSTARPRSVLLAGFLATTRETLARCLESIYQPDEAQKWMAEAAEIRQQHGLGNQHPVDQGLTQEQRLSAEGATLLAAEPTRANDPKYWLERARYSASLPKLFKTGEIDQADKAFKTGLSLAPPTPDKVRKGNYELRSRLLSEYVSHLRKQQRSEEAAELLWKELTQSPAMAASCGAAAHDLARLYPQQLTIDHAVLWTWLGNRSQWKDHIEGSLLKTMLGNAAPHEVDRVLTRAEQLAMNIDPSRALVLGLLENELKLPQRSIALLEYAAQATDDENVKSHALYNLVDVSLDAADWRRAEAAIRKSYAYHTQAPKWLSRAAVLAAEAGHKADAMRLWRQVANLDLTLTEPVKQLANSGLKPELITFYREMQTALPNSEVPPRVLASLGFSQPHAEPSGR